MTEQGGTEPTDLGGETPEADAVEQAQSDTIPAATAPAGIRDDVPEADAVEQAQGEPAVGVPASIRSIPDDVPEADALEQAYEVELDDDYRG